MKRIHRTDGSLRDASRAIDYEVSMIGNTLRAMLESPVDITSSPADRLVANALLHSFLLATRNLCKFLHSYDAQPNDIIAEDFFDDSAEWGELRPATPAEFERGALAKLISRRLLHLTYERSEGTKPSWGSFRIAWELTGSLEAFVAHVKTGRLSNELIEDVHAFVRFLKNEVDRFGSVDDVQAAPLSALWQEEDFWTNPRRAEPDAPAE